MSLMVCLACSLVEPVRKVKADTSLSLHQTPDNAENLQPLHEFFEAALQYSVSK